MLMSKSHILSLTFLLNYNLIFAQELNGEVSRVQKDESLSEMTIKTH